MIEIRQYRRTRFRAVYVDGELLAVVVYRKGAMAVADLLLKCACERRPGKPERVAARL
jgi:transposase-like protein